MLSFPGNSSSYAKAHVYLFYTGEGLYYDRKRYRQKSTSEHKYSATLRHVCQSP